MFDLAVREDDWARADTLIRRKFPERLPYDVRVGFAVFRKDTAGLRLLRAEGQEAAGQKGGKLAATKASASLHRQNRTAMPIIIRMATAGWAWT